MSRFTFDNPPARPIIKKTESTPGMRVCRPGILAVPSDDLSVVRKNMDYAKPDQQYVFLLGNGINFFYESKFPRRKGKKIKAWHDILIDLTMMFTSEYASLSTLIGNQRGNDRFQFEKSNEWYDSLVFLTKKLVPDPSGLLAFMDEHVKQQTEKNPLLPDTELFNLLQLLVNRQENKEKNLLMELKKSVNTRWSKTEGIALLDFIKNRNADVLTTNFDFHLEQYFWGRRPERKALPGSTDINNVHYPWNRCRFEKEDGCRVWHIHGDAQFPNSIQFSLSRYMKMGAIARDLLKEQNLERLKGTWLYRFLNQPLVIVGLGLGQSEIFLRWLLWERVIWQRHHDLTLPPSYYLCRRKDENPVQEQFLKILGFQTLYSDVENLYNGEIWK